MGLWWVAVSTSFLTPFSLPSPFPSVSSPPTSATIWKVFHVHKPQYQPLAVFGVSRENYDCPSLVPLLLTSSRIPLERISRQGEL